MKKFIKHVAVFFGVVCGIIAVVAPLAVTLRGLLHREDDTEVQTAASEESEDPCNPVDPSAPATEGE